jgi:ubiquitin C-terminal hydrolase
MVQPLRFQFDGTKNSATMELETRVTLGLHATEAPLGYTLCAVIVHSGCSLLTGHYWSCAPEASGPRRWARAPSAPCIAPSGVVSVAEHEEGA